MKKIVLASLILLIFSSSLYAGEIYTYKDKDGNTVISNTPIPEKYEKKAKKIEEKGFARCNRKVSSRTGSDREKKYRGI